MDAKPVTSSVGKASPYHGTRVLVLGASGFIGRWVARALTRHGAELFLVVRNRSIALPILEQHEIIGEIIEADLGDVQVVRELITTSKPEITFNLVGYGIDRTEHDETIAYQINARLGFVLCQILSSLSFSGWKGQALVHAGSALEYGPIGGNFFEDSVPRPTTIYGRSKLAGTQLILYCCQLYGIRGMSVRIFQAYGPGEHRERLSPTLLRAARTHEAVNLTLGEQKRDFIYVEDVAEGLVRLGLSTVEWGEVVNLATGYLTSVRSFVETAASILTIPKENLLFGTLPTPDEELSQTGISIERLKHLAGWTPPTTIEQGIRKTLEFSNQHEYEV